MISVRGAHYSVIIVKESKSVWMVRGDYCGEMIEVRASSELSALSRWQAQAQARARTAS